MSPSPASLDPPSLEALVESGMIELESLHPGGLLLTAELADLCAISTGLKVLDVACGTGESACYLAEKFGARVCGLDRSEALLARASDKAGSRSLDIQFCRGDAATLPFPDGEFDVVVCECTLCLLDKMSALSEMVRVVRRGGRVGIHDLYWDQAAAGALRDRLTANEGEEPETFEGWKRLFERGGLVAVAAVDRSELKTRWMRDVRGQLGLAGQLRLGVYATRRWGFGGLWRILRSEHLFSNRRLGYALVVGTRS